MFDQTSPKLVWLWLSPFRICSKPRAARFGAIVIAAALAPLFFNIATAAETQKLSNTAPHGLTLKSAIKPAVKHGGLSMDGQILWCPSVIKVDGLYHMFASRWPEQYGMAGWTSHSEVIRATSTNLYGPYAFQEVVLQKRTNNWDNSRVHNPKIVKASGKFVIFHIDTANETGLAYAENITGPWTRLDKSLVRVSNPAIYVKPDQSIYLFGRLGDSNKVNRDIAFTAPSYLGPYRQLANGDNLLEGNAELEDPTIWFANGQYNLLVNDWKGKATGTNKAGTQYFSKDGLHYKLLAREPIFTKEVVFDDGTTESFRRRERPFVYTNENGEVLALMTACLPDKGPARIIINPVDHYLPGNQ